MEQIEHESEQKIIAVAERLASVFPSYDLRFNWLEGSDQLRCIVADISDEVLEFPLTKATDEIIWEAIFAVKELAQLFDD